MAEAGLQEVETYVYRRQNTVTQFIATRTIKDICLAAEHKTGHRYPSVSGNRTGWMWRGCKWWLRRWNGQREERIQTEQR